MNIKILMMAMMLIAISNNIFAQVSFAEVETTLPGMSILSWTQPSYIALGDYDDDGDSDVLLSNGTECKLYRNDSNANYVLVLSFSEFGGKASWGDYDNDGDLDILKGRKVYRNDGSDVFTCSATLATSWSYNSFWIDYDNDGYLDIVSSESAIKLYRNNLGSFDYACTISDLSSGFDTVSLHVFDFDCDGDMDIIASGFREVTYADGTNIVTFNRAYTQILKNNSGVFVLVDFIPDVYFRASDALVVNSDRTTLLVVADHYETMYTPWEVIYDRIQSSYYTYSHITGLSPALDWIQYGHLYSRILLGDFDNDGDLDIVHSGRFYINYSWTYAIEYYNNSNGIYIKEILPINGLSNPCLDSWDVNSDGLLDFVVTGYQDGASYTKLFINTSDFGQNSLPTTPSNLRSESIGEYIYLHWDPASDAETTACDLSYSIRIGTSPNGHDVMSAMANSTGNRLVSGKGLVNGNCFWKIHKSAFHTGNDYYWSVQAIDNNYKGSAFSAPCIIPLPDPQIELVSSESMNFGNIYSGTSSEWLPIEFRSTGLGLIVSDVYLKHNSACFQIDQSSLGDLDDFGCLGSILVMFSPEFPGSFVDTLCVVSNAINLPIIEIRLSGNAVYVPPQPPNNLNVVITDSDVLLSWQAVNHDVLGHPITPDGYVILYNEIPNDDEHFWYLGFTESTNYTHHYVNIYRDSMFYKVLAVNYYRNEMLNRLKDLNESKVKYQWKQVKVILSDFEMDHLYNDD